MDTAHDMPAQATPDDFQNPSNEGTPDGAAWFRAKLAEIGESQRSLARLLVRYGDDRKLETITRHIGRIAGGQARVPGEMRALLNMIQRGIERRERRLELEAERGLERIREALEASAATVPLTAEERAKLDAIVRAAAVRGQTPP
jgi:hypothetical protein